MLSARCSVFRALLSLQSCAQLYSVEQLFSRTVVQLYSVEQLYSVQCSEQSRAEQTAAEGDWSKSQS